MQIHGPHGPNGLSPILPQRPTGAADSVRPSTLEFPRDEIQISAEARLLEEISRTGDVQHARVDEIRRMIASGVYETPEKMAVALDKLLDELRPSGPALR
jgi:anti-sigma28 factor (negative regulator of flagellin synthesis)